LTTRFLRKIGNDNRYGSAEGIRTYDKLQLRYSKLSKSRKNTR